MKFWSDRDDPLFLSRFDAFWGTVKGIEGQYRDFCLDPKHRYWIDTYPPMTMWRDGRKPPPKKTGLNLEIISQECRDEIFSLYFHLGFCRRRCSYCRQYEVHTIKDPACSDLLRQYVDRLREDIDVSMRLFPALQGRTANLYFGGGTPSLLPPRLLGSLLKHLMERIDLATLSPQSTFELNPEDNLDGLLELLHAVAMPRISIGVQSFDERILHSSGRRYARGDIMRVIEKVAEWGFRSVNLDLINGFPPHQDFAKWKRELAYLEPLFASGVIQSATLYPLHPFPNTRYTYRASDAYWQTRNLCFARAYLCDRLKLHEGPIYWFQKEPIQTEDAFAPSFAIFGYGNSSYSSLGRWLLQNDASLNAYLTHPRRNRSKWTLPIRHVFRLTPEQMQIRDLLFAIRSGSFRLGSRDWDQMNPLFKKHFRRFLQEGLLEKSEDRYRLTDVGKIFAHQMPILFFDAEVLARHREYLASRFAAATEPSRRS